MTEEQWLACNDPDAMREFLRLRELASERKLRLFAVAACRRVRHLLTDRRSHRAIEVAERCADGSVSKWEVQAAVEAAESAAATAEGARGRTAAILAARAACSASEHPFFLNAVAGFGADAASWQDDSSKPDPSRRAAERAAQSALLRDIFPNPFRTKPAIPAAVLAWADRCAVRLAAGIYEESDFSSERMSVLADALEEGGCPDAAILAHLRSPGPHVRGCWALDLVLGKE